MLLGGDELGRTQGGNNNAWCQDNEISWFDWELDEAAGRRCSTSRRRLIELRRATRSSGARTSSTAALRSRRSPTRGGSGPTGGRWLSATGRAPRAASSACS